MKVSDLEVRLYAGLFAGVDGFTSFRKVRCERTFQLNRMLGEVFESLFSSKKIDVDRKTGVQFFELFSLGPYRCLHLPG